MTFLLRTWCLLEVPPGLTHDEASNAHDASGVLNGQHAIYFPVGYGHEPLYNYSVALFTLLAGESIYTLRFTSVVWSIITWSLSVALSRRWWGRRASLLTGAIFAISFWAQMMARIGLRAPVLPALFTASVLFYDRAIKNERRMNGDYLFSGLCLGASFYTYMASRGLPFVYAALLISQLFVNRHVFRKIWRGTCVVIGVALIVGSPLFLYLYANPELEQRVAQLGGSITAFFNGNWNPLLKNITASLPLMLWRADPRWLYNIGGRAALEPFLAVLFCAGVFAALLKLRDIKLRLLLLWLGGGVAPALLTRVEYNTLHAVTAMPAGLLLATYGLNSILTYLTTIDIVSVNIDRKFRPKMFNKSMRILLYAGIISMFVVTGIESMTSYFDKWGQNREVRVAYHHHVVKLGRELKKSSAQMPAVITSLYPGEFHDPYTMDIVMEEGTLPLRWVDGRSAVFVPGKSTRLYIEEQTMLPTTLWQFVEPYTQRAADIVFRSDDIPGIINAYKWDGDKTWDLIMASFASDFYSSVNDSQLQGPINYGGIIHLDAYHIPSSELMPSLPFTVLTAWSIQKPYPDELKIFVHLLDGSGAIIAQQDYLGAPAWQWVPGDRFLHLHSIDLPDAIDSPVRAVAIGLYQQKNYSRLPVENQALDLDHIIIRMEPPKK